MAQDPRLPTVERLSGAFGEELTQHDPDEAVPWPELPTVAALADHVGFIHRWVTAVLRSRGPVPDDDVDVEHGPDVLGWYAEGRALLSAALAETPADAPCWVLGEVAPVAGFWRRRMVFEHAKHLTDLRAAGGRGWRPAVELGSADHADGVDELFEVMLPRFRHALPPLPAVVALEATDTADVWRIEPDWTVRRSAGDASARISASAADLAMAVWERADPLREPSRFMIDGDRRVAEAFTATRIHPW